MHWALPPHLSPQLQAASQRRQLPGPALPGVLGKQASGRRAGAAFWRFRQLANHSMCSCSLNLVCWLPCSHPCSACGKPAGSAGTVKCSVARCCRQFHWDCLVANPQSRVRPCLKLCLACDLGFVAGLCDMPGASCLLICLLTSAGTPKRSAQKSPENI